MTHYLRELLAVGVVFVLMATQASAQDEMAPNPFYKFWANSKPGSTVTRVETTKLTGPEGKAVPDGVDEKHITYKLVELNAEHAIVEMVVTEEDFLGYVQAAPTRYIFPAKVKKSHLEHIVQEPGKPGEDTIKFEGKEMKVKTLTGAVKGPDGEVIDYKLWLSDDVPGSIVKQVRTVKQKGEVTAETTTVVKSFKKAE
jgi:hypothetical protein